MLGLSLAACGGEDAATGRSYDTGIAAPVVETNPSTQKTADATAARFLLQATFATSRSEVDAVKKEGASAWLDRQMGRPNDNSAKDYFIANNLDEVAGRLFQKDQLTDAMIWSLLFGGGNGVRKRVALALSEFFVVSANNLNVLWPSQAVGEFWDLLNEHAFGNFRDLLEAVTLNPAMGAFLDTIGNQKEDPATGRVPDENFAREIMQLFTIGLAELNIDGTPRLGAGQPIETYSNEDVIGLARVFTGYDLDASSLRTRPDPGRPVDLIPDAEIVRRPLTADPSKWRYANNGSEHSLLEKRFLGTSIPAGTGPEDSLRIALDTLFNHPNVGPFFGKQMIQRLVTSNPSPAYVQRVAEVFNNNGNGVRGDLAAVFKAVLLDPDAMSDSGLNDQRFGKLREPAIRFVQLARTFGLSAKGGLGVTRDLSNSSNYIGQVPLRSPSVFNFFRPGYVTAGSWAAVNDMVAPEFQLVDETSVAGYLNFLERTITGDGFWLNDLKPDYSTEIALAEDTSDLIDHLDLILTAYQLRDATKASIARALDAIPIGPQSSDAQKLVRVHTAIMLIMASYDYLIQK